MTTYRSSCESGAAELEPPGVDLIKAVNRRFVTGVTVVTTSVDGAPKGLAVNAFSSISLMPPTVLVCVQHTSTTHDALFASEFLAINILSTAQIDVLSIFSTKAPDKFATIAWHAGAYGSPIIEGSAAYLEVTIRERLRSSTHTIFIGEVLDAGVSDVPAMVYSAGRFFDGGELVSLA